MRTQAYASLLEGALERERLTTHPHPKRRKGQARLACPPTASLIPTLFTMYSQFLPVTNLDVMANPTDVHIPVLAGPMIITRSVKRPSVRRRQSLCFSRRRNSWSLSFITHPKVRGSFSHIFEAEVAFYHTVDVLKEQGIIPPLSEVSFNVCSRLTAGTSLCILSRRIPASLNQLCHVKVQIETEDTVRDKPDTVTSLSSKAPSANPELIASHLLDLAKSCSKSAPESPPKASGSGIVASELPQHSTGTVETRVMKLQAPRASIDEPRPALDITERPRRGQNAIIEHLKANKHSDGTRRVSSSPGLSYAESSANSVNGQGQGPSTPAIASEPPKHAGNGPWCSSKWARFPCLLPASAG